MQVAEIFSSIDGEGLTAGGLATFIRLAGCNLRCTYCDTRYALRPVDGVKMSIQSILSKVRNIGFKHVTLTGGEPLVYNEACLLVSLLADDGFLVNIETNGSRDITYYLQENVTVTMDYKTPYSGQEASMRRENLPLLRPDDVLKFVVGPGDLSAVQDVLLRENIQSWIYLSPVFGKVKPAELVDFAKSFHASAPEKAEKLRVQVQLHKIIWPADMRGV